MRAIYRLSILGSLLLLAGCTSLSSLFFYPQSIWISTPEAANLRYQDVWLDAADGTGLHAWWLPAQREGPDSNTMLLNLEGNAKNNSWQRYSIYLVPGNGGSGFALDYRGFGASEGKALMPDVLQDIEA